MFRGSIEMYIEPGETPRKLVKALMASRRMFTMLYLLQLGLPNVRAAFLTNPNKYSAEDMMDVKAVIPPDIHSEKPAVGGAFRFIFPDLPAQKAATLMGILPEYISEYIKETSSDK